MSIYLLAYITITVLTCEYAHYLVASGFADERAEPKLMEDLRKYPTLTAILWFCLAVIWPIYWALVFYTMIKKG